MVSSADARRVIRNAPYRINGVILAVSTLRPVTGGLTSTAATLDKDNGGFNSATNTGSVTELGTTGFFYLDLTAAEMTADHVSVNVTASNSGAVYFIASLTPEACLDSGVAQAGGSSTITLRAAASSTSGLFVPGTIELVRGTGAGQIRGIAGYNGSQVATVDRAWTTVPSSDTVYVIHPRPHGVYDSSAVQQSNAVQINSNATAAANLMHAYAGGLIYDSIMGTPTTSQFVGGGTATLNTSLDNFYVNSLVIFQSGALAGLGARVSSYTAATRTFGFSTALPLAPTAGDFYILIGHAE